ncbi:hypothetical protein [Pseudomonas sp. B21-053]|uniref:hypothetical protein n=1 Tax=Pseudomonas sp. B21-053 TaxID=2895493 RepID=UPI00223275E5|nr:hypothetical protein [Pseudomonas sp. B21-053]UZE10070.1 hypothetical protein LOY68_21495 [Pseudomonas sp. B21-053]
MLNINVRWHSEFASRLAPTGGDLCGRWVTSLPDQKDNKTADFFGFSWICNNWYGMCKRLRVADNGFFAT